jgi:excisionase family DNA binding protein
MRGKRRTRAERRTLSAAELAVLLETTTQHIYKLAAAGALPHFRVSGDLRFDPELIEEWRKRNSLSAIKLDSVEDEELN